MFQSDGSQLDNSVASSAADGAYLGSDADGQKNLLKIELPSLADDVGGFYTVSVGGGASGSVLIWTNDNETGQVVPGVTTFDASRMTTRRQRSTWRIRRRRVAILAVAQLAAQSVVAVAALSAE